MIAGRTGKRLVFGDGVVVGLAFAVAEPSQEGQGDYDDPNTDAEFRTSLHKSPLKSGLRLNLSIPEST